MRGELCESVSELEDINLISAILLVHTSKINKLKNYIFESCTEENKKKYSM